MNARIFKERIKLKKKILPLQSLKYIFPLLQSN